MAGERGRPFRDDALKLALPVGLPEEGLDDVAATAGEHDGGRRDVLEGLLDDVRVDGFQLVDELADDLDDFGFERLHGSAADGVVLVVAAVAGVVSVACGVTSLPPVASRLLANDVEDPPAHVAHDQLCWTRRDGENRVEGSCFF